VSIGATLAAARRRGGLTVSEISRRTRVTEPIIRGIEQDDYAACGGDFYARGHIRAIARAVGEDPVPLIDEFDSTWRSADEPTAAEAFGPSLPRRNRERRRVRWTAILAVLVLAVLGFASYKFVSGASGDRQPQAGTSPRQARAGTPPAGTPSVQASGVPAGSASASTPAGPSASAPASPSASASASPVAARRLVPASVAAFGPAGTADGDNPQLAAQAVAGDPAAPWYSQWYATPEFGALKAGTGLLVDMGRAVTVSRLQVSMLTRSGAGLELRAGASPEPSALRRVASAANAGGTVVFRLGSPVHVRYLLLWFTKLPPDGAGTYQVSIYRITVQGQPDLPSSHE
jgi:cytoskeletal protein RodZ